MGTSLFSFPFGKNNGGVCRTMKIENYVHKLHGVGREDLSASDCLSPPSLLLVVMCREGGV